MTVTHLKLHRFHFGSSYAVGRLMIDNVFQCFTMEDAVREIRNKPVSIWKIAGRTAIPRGTYEVKVTTSQRFQKPLPLLLDVPGFSGIRIHSGNSSADSEGCILVGHKWDGGDWISQSTRAMNELMERLSHAQKPMYMEVE